MRKLSENPNVYVKLTLRVNEDGTVGAKIHTFGFSQPAQKTKLEKVLKLERTESDDMVSLFNTNRISTNRT